MVPILFFIKFQSITTRLRHCKILQSQAKYSNKNEENISMLLQENEDASAEIVWEHVEVPQDIFNIEFCTHQ